MDHALATEGVSTLVWLLVAVMAVAVASKYLRIPYTVALAHTHISDRCFAI